MPVIVMRHGERTDYVDPAWVSSAARPWDPPLTEEGRCMAVRAGAAVKTLCSAHGLPQPSVVLSSPLLRCAETSVQAAQGMGFGGKIGVEPALCETICEDWYRSWAVPGANGQWGGPAGCGIGTEVADTDLHPAARGPCAHLFQAPSALMSTCGGEVDEAYCPAVPAELLDYSWGRYEATHGTDESTGRRIGAFCDSFDKKNPGITFVVCTHGGPSAACYRFLTGTELTENVGYTGIHVLVRDPAAISADNAANAACIGAGWRAVETCSSDHVAASTSS